MKKKFFLFIKSMRLTRHIHYSVIFFLGFLIGVRKLHVEFDFFLFLKGLVLINFLFFNSLLLNNFFDKKIDTFNKKPNPFFLGVLSTKSFLILFIISLIFSILLSIYISIYVFYITILILFTSFIYSAPPLRLKKIFPLNILLISFSTVITLFLGFTTSTYSEYLSLFPYNLGILMFIVLSMAFNVKDINDFYGDKKDNVKTIMTIFGEFYGKIIISILVLIGYIFVPIFLNFYSLLIFSIICGGITVLLLFNKNKVNEGLVFIVFFIYIGIFIYYNPLNF